MASPLPFTERVCLLFTFSMWHGKSDGASVRKSVIIKWYRGGSFEGPEGTENPFMASLSSYERGSYCAAASV